jgi:hypothetical protein
MADVTIYEHANFNGRSRTFAVGQYRLFDSSDMNDMASSIKVPKGLVAYVYEHADNGGGYGISADFLEDCADLSQFNFNDKISYIHVFSSEDSKSGVVVRDHQTGEVTTGPPQQFIWARNSVVNGAFIAGHWERKRAGGQPPTSPVAVFSPPIPPHDFAQPVLTGGGTVAEPASAELKNHVIQMFLPFAKQANWDHARSNQMGIIGSDFRGVEEIGSAAFERASNQKGIPDSINFWYPQKQSRDHRSIVYFKRTLAGTLLTSHVADISGIYEDYDLNIDIEPSGWCSYLVTDAHPREYTAIMSAEWNLSGNQFGQPDCNDSESIAETSFIEAEINTSLEVSRRLDMILNSALGRQICVYGPWIYDRGHCCHAEIHPAEQIWWSDPSPGGRVYICHLFCDESQRFWWRNQMDEGTKLKPWGAPPITGTFAIAFEAEVNSPAKQFQIAVQDAYNNVTVHENFKRHHLVYQNNTLAAVIQDPADLVKVSFEDVGLAGANTVRGFIVIEATVGTCIQNPNPIARVPRPGGGGASNPPPSTEFDDITLPPGSDPNTVPEELEHLGFRKEAGRLVLIITQGPPVPQIAHYSRELDFGTVGLGQDAKLTLHIVNVGLTDLVVTIPASAFFAFSWHQVGATTIAPGATLDVLVTFEPNQQGHITGTLTVQHNGAGGQQVVQLQGDTRKGPAH